MFSHSSCLNVISEHTWWTWSNSVLIRIHVLVEIELFGYIGFSEHMLACLRLHVSSFSCTYNDFHAFHYFFCVWFLFSLSVLYSEVRTSKHWTFIMPWTLSSCPWHTILDAWNYPMHLIYFTQHFLLFSVLTKKVHIWCIRVTYANIFFA